MSATQTFEQRARPLGRRQQDSLGFVIPADRSTDFLPANRPGAYIEYRYTPPKRSLCLAAAIVSLSADIDLGEFGSACEAVGQALEVDDDENPLGISQYSAKVLGALQTCGGNDLVAVLQKPVSGLRPSLDRASAAYLARSAFSLAKNPQEFCDPVNIGGILSDSGRNLLVAGADMALFIMDQNAPR